MRPTAATRWNTTRQLFIAFIAVIVLSVFLVFSLSDPARGSDAADDVGLWDPTTGQWHLREANGEVRSFYFGRPGDVPILGDWDCNGTDTAGMFRPSNGFAYLTNENATSVAEVSFFFGQVGDTPIVGDWNGNGCDTLGVYRDGEVLLRDTLSTGPADTRFYFGKPGDRPFIGDFNGDGISTVGLHRIASGLVYFRNSLDTGPAHFQFFYGQTGDHIIAGDWNHDGTDTIGIFRPGQARFYLSNSNLEQPADLVFDFGKPPWLPVAGRLFQVVPPPPPPPPPPTPAGDGPVLYRVNAGGEAIAATDGGPDWSGDTPAKPSVYTNASAALSSTANWNVATVDNSIEASVPSDIFASERWDQPAGHEMLWRFPVEQGSLVQVNLYFSSGFDPVGNPGERVFNIHGDRNLVTKAFDIVGSAGHRIGTRRSYYAYAEDGGVDIWFEHVINNPQLNGIEIIQQSGTDVTFEGPGPAIENGDFLRYGLGELARFRPPDSWIAEVGSGAFSIRPDAHDPVFRLVENLTIRGAGPGLSTLIGGNVAGPAVAGANGARLENLTVQVGKSSGARGILNRATSAVFENVTVNAGGANAEAITNIDSAGSFENVIVHAPAFVGAAVINNVGGAPHFRNLTVAADGDRDITAIRNEASRPTFDSASISVSSSARTAHGMVNLSGSVVSGSDVAIRASMVDPAFPVSVFNGIFSLDSVNDFSRLTVNGTGQHLTEIGIWSVGGDVVLDSSDIGLVGGEGEGVGLQIESGTASMTATNIAVAGDGVGVSATGSDIVMETTSIGTGTDSASDSTGIRITNGFLTATDASVDSRGTASGVAVSLDSAQANLVGGSYRATSTSSAQGLFVTSGRLNLASTDVSASAISPIALVVVDSSLDVIETVLTARDGAEGTVLHNRASDIRIEASTLVVNAGGGRATGIENVGSNLRPAPADPVGAIRVLTSTITAATHMVLNLPGVETVLESSTLAGGNITDPYSQVFCTNVTDENSVFYPTSCPPND